MARKKKKTIASTKRKETEMEVTQEQKRKKAKKGLLFKRKESKKERKAAEEKEEKKEKKEEKPREEKVREENSSEKKPREQRTPLSPQQKEKIKGGVLMLIGLGTLLFVGSFLFGKLFSPQDLAELISAQNAVAVVEVNSDGNSGQVKQFYQLLDKYPVYQREGVVMLVNTLLPVNYQNDLEPWLGRQVGLALTSPAVSAGTEGGPFEFVFFVESRDHDRTLEFLKSKALSAANEEVTVTEYKGFKIYEFTISQPMSFTFVNNYLVAAKSLESMRAYLDGYLQGPRLSDDADYRKVANNLPHGGLAFAYVHFGRLFSALEKDERFVAQKGQDMLSLRPFLKVFKAEGFSLFAENDRFVAQNFTSIDTEALDGENYITFSERYEGNLLKLINADPVFVAGGHDLTKELSRIEDLFKSGTKTPALVFEGLVEAQKQRYFGKDIDLRQDIYPLFTGEYLVAVENSFEDPTVSLLMELSDNSASVSRFDKIVNSFIQVSGVFSPRVQEVELPDGTMGKEIVASPEKIERSTGKYKEKTITSLRLGDTGVAIHYVILENIVAMSTKEKTLQQIIDRHEGEMTEGLASSKYYERNIRPVLRTADQVLHVKLGALTQLMGLGGNELLEPYLVPFNNFTVTKNFFEDGISTTYIVEVI